MSTDARRCMLLLCLPLLLSACGDPSQGWEAGGLYSVWEGETDFGVVKILAVDPEAVSVAWYGPTFASRPTSASSSELAAGVEEDANLGFDHLPLPWRDFELMYPIRIGSEEVSEAELENYRLWRETGAEPVSFEDLAMMNAALEELPDEPTSETGDPLQPVGEGDSIDE
jgi:hypothetical protein